MDPASKLFGMFLADGFGVAYGKPEINSVELIPDRGEINDWTPLELAIKPGEWAGPPGDYVNSNLIIRLCSRRLKDLLEAQRADADHVQWLPVFVTDLAGNRDEHFGLHFPEPPDVLNLEPGKSLFHSESGVLIRPCLSRSKVGNRKLFNIPGFEVTTVVDESVKRAIEAARMTGMEFEPFLTR